MNYSLLLARSYACRPQTLSKGLESAGKKIDDFLTYFPESEVSAVKEFIAEENALNEKEFDTKLGAIINPSPKV